MSLRGLSRCMKIRSYNTADTAQIVALFFDSVRNGTGDHYTREQREAWAPEVPNAQEWAARLGALHTFVAEDDAGIAGFMTLGEDGHIDLAYVRSDCIGRGVAQRLYEVIEAAAIDLKLKRLFSEASDLARRFFEKHGWRLIETRQVERYGVALTNHRMEKLFCDT
ncbi:MAG: GNAT family N-acetyltransferase [Proteobacteria bacterium]|nr:GNAT family N-acetyltransferase [Pseudomonadota bacterium]